MKANEKTYAAQAAASHWFKHGGTFPPPITTGEALARARRELRKPTDLMVDVCGKYPKIIAFDFTDSDDPDHWTPGD